MYWCFAGSDCCGPFVIGHRDTLQEAADLINEYDSPLIVYLPKGLESVWTTDGNKVIRIPEEDIENN